MNRMLKKSEKKERESIEWINTWWSEANTDHRRGLLIGDSVTRQLRGSIEMFLTNLYAVDLFASSFSIHDKRLEDYLDMLLREDEYTYDFIVLHYGGHHGFSRLCSESLEEYEAYLKQYTRLLKKLTARCEKVVCVTGTSEVLDTDVGTIDLKAEREIVARNQIVLTAARANGAEVFDLYDLMKKNSGRYTYFDRQHFNRDSDYFVSYNLLEFMLSKNVISEELVSRQHLQDRNRLMQKLGYDKEYMIYGAGAMGSELYWILKWYGMSEKVRYFVVSHETGEETFLQKPVVLLSDLDMNERENHLLVVSSDKYKEEMYQAAFASKICNVVFYKDMINGLLNET